ncbi:SAV_2336 N-terminal domain-related protein [Streptomyces sp. NPDC004327]|uniref:SAV_2336 N-terminal domain-related protein n=1 Tax=Streptomyces sp. NPDC004327 TaxID=3364699 RepID=UPI0036AC8EFC
MAAEGADRSRAPGALGALAALLGAAGDEPPTGRELAELLWLARQMEGGEPRRGPARRKRVVWSAPRSAVHKPPKPRPSRDRAPAGSPAPEPPAPPRVPLRTPAPEPVPAPGAGSGPGPWHMSLLAPAPPMLAGPLALQRSLRPLRRTVPATGGWELDEAATADRIASFGPPGPGPGAGAGSRLWLPVLRPRRERWLHLRIVYDAGPTMTLWRPLVRELHAALTQTGAFRTLDVLRLGPDGRLPSRHRERGRTAVLVVSDAMGPQWRDGEAGRCWRTTLAALGAELPVALLQPLPERLWRHTAAPAEPGMLASPAAGVPNTALAFTPYDGGPAPAGVPVPVLEPSEDWLGHWAALVASPAGAEVPGAAAFVTPCAGPPPEDDGLVPAGADPEELVLRFRSVASPHAFRLAAHLAVGSAHLPVMRLVQAAVEQHPEPRHLAEVVLSGMLRAEPGAAPGAYDFRPGVREVLLGTLPRSALLGTARLLALVSAEIEARAGALPGEFRALVESLAGQRGERAAGRPFALVSEESVRLLRGPERAAGGPATPPGSGPDEIVPPDLGERYEIGARLGRAGSRVWRGHDRYLDRPVALSYLFFPPPDERPEGHRNTDAVAADLIAHTLNPEMTPDSSLVQVLDVVVVPTGCCVVTELVEGRSLREYLDAAGALPVEEAVRIGDLVRTGLMARELRRDGHGDLTPSKILGVDGYPRLRDHRLWWPYGDTGPGAGTDPDRAGSFPLSPVPGVLPRRGTARYLAPERQREKPGPAADLYSLGCIVYEMLTGAPPFTDADLATVLRHHAETVPPLPSRLRPEVPPALDTAVRLLLSKDPAEREQGAWALSDLRRRPGRGLGSDSVAYRLLGPPQATVAGEDVSERAYERNAFLCRLLAARGLPVTEDEAAEAVRETPDVRPGTYALRLRTQGHPVELSYGSYRLPVNPASLDLLAAEALVGQADAALRRGDRNAARAALGSALALWYGEPLDGVPGAWAQAERDRLRDWRDELAGRLAELDDAPPDAPGVLLVRRRAGTRTEPSTLLGTLYSLVNDTRDRPYFGLVVPRSDGSIRTPLGHGPEAPRLVEWAVEKLPERLAAELPGGSYPPVRVDVVVHDGTEEAGVSLARAGREPTDAETAGALLIVTVLVSHRLRTKLPPALKARFTTVTATAEGWQLVVVFRHERRELAPGEDPGL